MRQQDPSRVRREMTTPVDRSDRQLELAPSGFHGDRYLHRLADSLLSDADVFVETGSNVGSTALWVLRRYPGLAVRSCEPHPQSLERARANLASHPRARVSGRPSPAFLRELLDGGEIPRAGRAVFWLDAHGGGFEWPLADEVALLTSELDSGRILIDDFEVPGRPAFKFDAYDGQVCGLGLVESRLAPGRAYRLVLPAYSERTSSFHPLIGVALIEWGSGWSLPATLRGSFSERTIGASEEAAA